MINCKYKMIFPSVGECCGRYRDTERADGKVWEYYPSCKEENCPIMHPELLAPAMPTAAKITKDGICLWCGRALEDERASFCSVYCANLWGGEGD